jgi:hypothetical protein
VWWRYCIILQSSWSINILNTCSYPYTSRIYSCKYYWVLSTWS